MVTNVSNDRKSIGNYLAWKTLRDLEMQATNSCWLAAAPYSFIAFARTLPEYLFLSVDVIAHNKRAEQQHSRVLFLYFSGQKREWIQFTL
jgi:hypothetical protein